ncbi:short-chain-fatty-acid-CoA ligase [Colletotrichum godetiae]|uniref:Short-chain-fatty-acid-CoA ligase n=1 Tax=Colletotrichum godetiae TaxID=1209918 RepID=A0AAJ0AZ22_9PEZI|nr:short-chain-fatty-acid-CoA ligase [Colletotrichum godetiae]KAK1700939.1 short-chain-fatty-acid-CoA ligase [Colletotrichum godetiae]
MLSTAGYVRLATGSVARTAAWRISTGLRPCTIVNIAGHRRGLSSGYEGLSFSLGPEEPPLLTQTIPQHFSQIVSQHGDLPAVTARSPTPNSSSSSSASPAATTTILTYTALDALSNTLAHGLRSLGVRKGDRLAVSLGNGAEFAALTYAAFKLGAVLVPLNPGFNAKQVGAALRHLGVECLIIGKVTDLPYKPCRGRSNLELLRTLVPDLNKGGGVVESEVVPSLRSVVVLDNAGFHPEVEFAGGLRALTPYDVLLESGSTGAVVPDAPLKPEDTINIQFTSGTTSQPKAAMLTHTSILNNGHLIAQRMGLVPGDRIVVPPPLFHCFGCVLGYMATATTGAGILFPSPAFDPSATLKMVADYDATGLYGVSTMFVAVLEALAGGGVVKREDMPRGLRKGIAAGSSVPESLMRRLYEVLGLRDLVICYGMTETSPVSCMTAPDDGFDKRTGSVGRAMPHTAVKIVDPADRGRVVKKGERGELAAAGYLVMKGYWGDEERTAEVRREEGDGRVWMYSGDEARMDEDGYVEITGRIKDLIIRGGENIHPLEIENCLFQMEGVNEVSVVGVPDEKLGESVAAFVVLKKGWRGDDGDSTAGGDKVIKKDEARAWVREHLSSHLVPKHVFWVDDYPKTPSGKIQKFKLRAMAKDLLEGKK